MVCRPSPEGSLKRYTEIPPVLDRFKKRFLHGTAGELRIFCREKWRTRVLGVFFSWLGRLCEELIVVHFFLGDDSKQNDRHGFVYCYKLVRFFFCVDSYSGSSCCNVSSTHPRFDFACI